MLDQDEIFEATIGSGVAYSIGDWLEQCFALVGKDWRDHVRLRPGFVSEYKQLVSNPKTMIPWVGSKRYIFRLARMMMFTEQS